MRRLALLTCVSLLALPILPAPEAEACGGTFCDNVPNSMPVDQTGENVLFVLDGQTVEAHIEIQYDPNTEAAKFAWIIPMLAVPEFEVGSDLLFDNLRAGSVPTYGFNNSFEPCGGGSEDGGESTSDTGDGDGDESTTDDTDTGDPNVVYQDVVGAFEIAVLQGGTIEGVMQWLGDNGYQQDPNAEPILGEYLNEGFLFVALKLATNTEVAEIHPIVLRYQGNEPCVPLRLTRIAAVEDMDVRVFFLGDNRMVPTNYRHVLVNPLKIDWINFASNYKEVISMAVDAFAAEGNAFVTEYAGASAVVSQSGLYSPSWDAAPFAAMANTPELVVDELATQGLADCFGGVCEFNHTMLKPLLDKYLPVPDGVMEQDFYGCLACYEGLIDDVAWDAAGFSADLQERVIAPGQHALTLLQSWDYLTRMFTTISPNEMTVDPIFHENADLGEVSNIQQGNRNFLCNGDAVFTLPDGREVYMPNPNVWPNVSDELPWEEDVEQAALLGPNQVLSDQTETINALLAAWNEMHGWPPDGGDGDGDGDGDTGESGSGSEGNEGWSGDGSEAESGGDDEVGDGPMAEGESTACGCTTDDSGLGGSLAALALFGFGLHRVSRRRSAG